MGGGHVGTFISPLLTLYTLVTCSLHQWHTLRQYTFPTQQASLVMVAFWFGGIEAWREVFRRTNRSLQEPQYWLPLCWNPANWQTYPRFKISYQTWTLAVEVKQRLSPGNPWMKLQKRIEAGHWDWSCFQMAFDHLDMPTQSYGISTLRALRQPSRVHCPTDWYAYTYIEMAFTRGL